MSEEIKDGGPAFPQINEQRYNDPIHGVIRPADIYGEAPTGLTVRQWYAGKALQGMLSIEGQHQMQYDSTAAQAFKFADSMLKEGSR